MPGLYGRAYYSLPFQVFFTSFIYLNNFVFAYGLTFASYVHALEVKGIRKSVCTYPKEAFQRARGYGFCRESIPRKHFSGHGDTILAEDVSQTSIWAGRGYEKASWCLTKM